MISFRGGINLKEYEQTIRPTQVGKTPDQAGASLWYHAEDTFTDAGITPTQNDNDPIYRWKDLIGTNNSNQTVLANRASFQADELNGYPIGRGGATVYYSMTSSLQYGDFTLLFVGSWGGNQKAIVGDGNDGYWGVISASPDLIRFRLTGQVETGFILLDELDFAGRDIWILRRTGNTLNLRKNGTNPATVASVVYVANNTNLSVFMSRRTALYNFTGDVADFAAWNSYQSDANVREVEEYFSDIYNIPLV